MAEAKLKQVKQGEVLAGLAAGAAVRVKVLEDVSAPTSSLDPGDDGPDMRRLERALAKTGHLDARFANGVWDFATETALKKFQEEWGLTPHGRYETTTQAALKKALAGGKPPKKATKKPPAGAPADAVETPAPISYAGGDDLAPYTDVGGTIYFVEDRPAKPDYWTGIRAKGFTHWKSSYTDKKTGAKMCEPYEYCGDVSGGDGEQYGPNCAFKVVSVGKGTRCGGLIQIKLPNGEVIKLLHFSTINVVLHEAAKSGADVPAGTYLGSTAKKIGLTSGPHLHCDSASRTHRSSWVEWMAGNLSAAKKKARDPYPV